MFVLFYTKKIVISNHHVRGDFLNAHFVGNNHEAAVSNLFAKKYSLSKPCFYYSSHSFAKSHKLTCCLLITQFHDYYYLRTAEFTQVTATFWITLI